MERKTLHVSSGRLPRSAEDRPYSYHTFLFPFLFGNHGTVSAETFGKRLTLTDKWEDDYDISQDDSLSAAEKGDTPYRQREAYRKYQYFNEASQRALMRRDGEIVSCFRLDLPDDRTNNTVCYIIRTIDESSHQEKAYLLNVNAVRLKLYNTGVAIMVFEMEYFRDEATTLEQARCDVKQINEFGRRMYPEFLPAGEELSEREKMLCADTLEFLWEQRQEGCAGSTEMIHTVDDFWKKCFPSTSTSCSYLEQPKQIPHLVSDLLTDKENSRFSLTFRRDEASETRFYIEPAIDSRMFVCCCVRDAGYVNGLLGYDPWDDAPAKQKAERKQRHEWRFLSDWSAAQELYAVTNIDKNQDASCQSRVMLDECFAQQLYLRWVEYGTIHAVTNHSMICLTSEDAGVLASVVDPFLTLYTQMCTLVLAQRASLIAFDADITEASKDGIPHADDREKLVELQKKFALFQGQLLLAEVTPQIQGIELYQKLQRMLFINELEENIQKQMTNLFEVIETVQGDRLNKYGAYLAVAGLLLALWQAREAFGLNWGQIFSHLLYAVVFTAVGILMLVAVRGKTKRFFAEVKDFFRRPPKKGG